MMFLVLIILRSVIDWICCLVADIRNVQFLDCDNDLLHGIFLYSRHFSKHVHFLGVCNPRVRICVDSSPILDDERTQVSRVDEGIRKDEHVLSIREH